MIEGDPTQRFTSRVEYYAPYRPGYPDALIELLEQEVQLSPPTVVADIGSGTGLLSVPFLRHGCTVYGVEPNAAMREAGERLLRHYADFHSVDGAAEATTLPDRCVQLITAGQSYHWFNVDRSRTEFLRILQPDCYVVLVWNFRQTDTTPFMRAYDALPEEWRTLPAHRPHPAPSERFAAKRQHPLFGDVEPQVRFLENRQEFDWDGFRGRVLSESSTPLPGAPRHGPMMAALRELFDAHQENGKVVFHYNTLVRYGRLHLLDSSKTE